LKKAELAKRQGNSSLDFEASVPATGMSLEPVPDGTAPLSLDPLRPQPFETSVEPPRSKFPDLPSHLEDLEVQAPPKVIQEPSESVAPNNFAARSEEIRPVRQPEPPLLEAPAKPSPVRPALTESPRPATATSESVKTKSEQQAAKNVFVAKANGEAETGKKNRLFLIGISIVTLCSVVGIGGYFWWQLQPKSGLGALPTGIAARPASPGNALAPSATVASAPASTTQPISTVVSPATPTVSPVSEASTSGKVPLADQVIDQIKQVTEVKTLTDANAKPATRAENRRSIPPSLTTDGDRVFTVTKSPLRINPALGRGYESYERGDLANARKEYQAVLKADPYNLDALRAMAVISLREDRPDAAESYFQRALVSDPQDAFAISGLANLRGTSSPVAAETRLKNIAIAQPDNAAPHFALGNVYAAQEKWSEAQQAYFKAYSVEPGNPDILYNLAISLEHLRQNKLAVQYYNLAIQAATNRPSGFDPAQATARVRALQP
jgi:Tfp pilus assembly protein PilF